MTGKYVKKGPVAKGEKGRLFPILLQKESSPAGYNALILKGFKVEDRDGFRETGREVKGGGIKGKSNGHSKEVGGGLWGGCGVGFRVSIGHLKELFTGVARKGNCVRPGKPKVGKARALQKSAGTDLASTQQTERTSLPKQGNGKVKLVNPGMGGGVRKLKVLATDSGEGREENRHGLY